jgi:Raf kinase inhibitor-like YbhB/YbcL family protein
VPLVLALSCAGCGGSSKAAAGVAGDASSTTTATTTSTSSGSSRTTSAKSAQPRTSSTSTSNSTTVGDSKTITKISGHILLPSGPMTISSSAFSEGGTIPSPYTCDGQDISPPFSWSRVPAKTAELFLFVLDETSNGPEGGIRWVVGGIDPSARGVAAGKVPRGGVVGRNSSGTVDYGGICPPKGKTHLITAVLYALRKRFPLSTGFDPQEAERHFPNNTFESAETYGGYRRPIAP